MTDDPQIPGPVLAQQPLNEVDRLETLRAATARMIFAAARPAR
ncbi:hypothetical protein [Actinomadura pelletieri]|nr:hypothetical protein [Actinomadura pelletieri]